MTDALTTASRMSGSSDTAMMKPLQTGRFLPALVILFVGSGCAALIYEIVWLQMLQLVIGVSALSLGVLLGTFMGGMCLGSLLFPRIVSMNRHPLRVYAMLELAIGAIGLIELKLVPVVADLYTHIATAGSASVLLRAALAGICLLPPTILMGATLPAIARWVEATPRGVSWLGFFYGGNILGAVSGCLLAGFYLLPKYDMKTATEWAAVINATVAGLGLLLSLVTTHEQSSKEMKRPSAMAAPGAWSIYVAIGLSGLTGLGAEVVWTRMLSLMLGATVYTFSLILAVFLLGLGIGSSVGSMIARRSPRAARGAGVVPVSAGGGDCVGGVCDHLFDTVLADGSARVAAGSALVYVSGGFGAVLLGGVAGGAVVGGEFSIGAGGAGGAGAGFRPIGRRGLCRQYRRGHHRIAGVQHDHHSRVWHAGGAADFDHVVRGVGVGAILPAVDGRWQLRRWGKDAVSSRRSWLRRCWRSTGPVVVGGGSRGGVAGWTVSPPNWVSVAWGRNSAE